MVAAAVLLIAIMGLMSIMNQAVHATAIGHRRTVAAFTRQALLDRVAVTPRDRLAMLTRDGFRLDACYDLEGQVIESNPTLAADFESSEACAAAVYRSWLHVEAVAAPTPFPGARAFRVRTYAERVDPGCDEDDRYGSVHCVAADTLLTD
jgi:hypothetical protein